jgi:uncharacterized protein (TIGR00369 family)
MTSALNGEEITAWLGRSPFVAFMGLTLVDLGADGLSLGMDFRPEFGRSPGSEPRWHGGVVAALIDTAGDFALIAMTGSAPPTVNFRVDYLRPAVGARLTATARIRKAGRWIGFVDVDVIDPDGRLVAIGRANYAVVEGSSRNDVLPQ